MGHPYLMWPEIGDHGNKVIMSGRRIKKDRLKVLIPKRWPLLFIAIHSGFIVFVGQVGKLTTSNICFPKGNQCRKVSLL